MPQTKRRRGWKACDPFCSDKVRKALYNRPNGAHQGKLIMGKTYLSGIDGKCFSRTGRIKRGYRNIPIDIKREFEIEKRQIKQIQNIINGPSQKVKNKRIEKKKLQKIQYQQQQQQQQQKMENKLMHQNNQQNNEQNNEQNNQQNNEQNNQQNNEQNNGQNNEQNNEQNNQQNNEQNNDELPEQKIMNESIQSMDKLSRFPNESFRNFIRRVNKTTSYHLNEKKNRENAQRLKRRQKNFEKKLKREQRKIEIKRITKLEDKKRRKEQREFENKIKPKKEYIPFGATNDRPPDDLHKLGAKIFGSKIFGKRENKNNLNISGLSFSNIIQRRAQQIKKQEILKNYALSKQKRYFKVKMNNNKKRKRKAW